MRKPKGRSWGSARFRRSRNTNPDAGVVKGSPKLQIYRIADFFHYFSITPIFFPTPTPFLPFSPLGHLSGRAGLHAGADRRNPWH